MQNLFPLIMFAFVCTITPGPNNIMLTTSGIAFGFTRTIPHMLGISFGVGALLALCAAGIGGLIFAWPSAQFALKIASSAYLLYLAWRLRSMNFDQTNGETASPMSFLQAALFQFANPKAWVMSVTGASAFLPVAQPGGAAVATFCLVFCATGLPCIGVWAGTGSLLRRYLKQPLWRGMFVAAMILLTLCSALAIWL